MSKYWFVRTMVKNGDRESLNSALVEAPNAHAAMKRGILGQWYDGEDSFDDPVMKADLEAGEVQDSEFLLFESFDTVEVSETEADLLRKYL